MKRERQEIFDKYGGKCAYCGCDLDKSFHVDHLEPVRRDWEYVNNPDGRTQRRVITGMVNPDKDNQDNKMPSCPKCNIMKNSYSLEEFRRLIGGFVNSLNRYQNQYKFAKKYGLVEETGKPVIFYFETLNTPH